MLRWKNIFLGRERGVIKPPKITSLSCNSQNCRIEDIFEEMFFFYFKLKSISLDSFSKYVEFLFRPCAIFVSLYRFTHILGCLKQEHKNHTFYFFLYNFIYVEMENLCEKKKYFLRVGRGEGVKIIFP